MATAGDSSSHSPSKSQPPPIISSPGPLLLCEPEFAAKLFREPDLAMKLFREPDLAKLFRYSNGDAPSLCFLRLE